MFIVDAYLLQIWLIAVKDCTINNLVVILFYCISNKIPERMKRQINTVRPILDAMKYKHQALIYRNLWTTILKDQTQMKAHY